MRRYFAVINDPRHQGYVKHKLNDILMIVMCAVPCGMDQLCDVIAVDGKAIRSTAKARKPHSALQIITIYLTETGVVLGQEKIREKTSEIPVFQKMLSYLSIKGKIITADAMHCQRDTCAMITEQGGDYVDYQRTSP